MTKASDVLSDPRPYVRREFDGDECSEAIHRLRRPESRRQKAERRRRTEAHTIKVPRPKIKDLSLCNLHNLWIDHRAGVKTTVSFVAEAIAALLNGNARGVTLRQSSS